MHAFLRFLSRRRWPVAGRYGATAVAVALVTLIRLVAPLDTAPYLLYLPVVFLCGLTFGLGPGILSVILSDAIAGWFFLRAAPGHFLGIGQIVASAQFLVVGSTMAAICDALRRAIIQNETAMADLIQNRAWLQAAKDEADSAKETAESANRAKSAFLANMSHELRTPLSAVIGYSEMLEEEAQDRRDAPMLTDLGKIKSNAKHLLGLINDVLDLSKIEAEKMDTVAETADVALFVQDAAVTVQSLMARRANSFALELGPDLGHMHTDTVKLRQCLFNLLGNAAKFTENGRITLSAQRSAHGWLRFSVRDTGIGMTPDQVARLFQRFTQADQTTTRKFGGTGLGLALSRAFAQLLGGDITVESLAGEGTCFTLAVPASLSDIRQVDEDERSETTRADARDVVLVVDDEESQRDLLVRFLERQGFVARTAANGEAGLEAARRILPRVILLDVLMPGMDGWAVLQALKADALTAPIPVVMVSFAAEAAMGVALGAADTVTKPVDWIRLQAVMDRFHDAAGDILVVDDDADMRQRLRAVLERGGWSVTEARDGAEALDRVRTMPPQLILLDLTMPVMDGFAFLEHLRALPGCTDVPVVVLSAREIGAGERERLAAANRVLRKDAVSMRELAAEIRQLGGR